jgi:Asp-tRNAAsn/Glu-tRNAGln amidotransferase B subunit (PET112 homolog)
MLEIVTEPDIEDAKEAKSFLDKLKSIWNTLMSVTVA